MATPESFMFFASALYGLLQQGVVDLLSPIASVDMAFIYYSLILGPLLGFTLVDLVTTTGDGGSQSTGTLKVATATMGVKEAAIILANPDDQNNPAQTRHLWL